MHYAHKNMVFYSLIVKYHDNPEIEEILKNIIMIEPTFCWALSPYINENCINAVVGFSAHLLTENPIEYIIARIFCQEERISKFAIIDEMHMNAEFIKTINKFAYSTFYSLPIFEWAKENKHIESFRSCDQNVNKYDFNSFMDKT